MKTYSNLGDPNVVVINITILEVYKHLEAALADMGVERLADMGVERLADMGVERLRSPFYDNHLAECYEGLKSLSDLENEGLTEASEKARGCVRKLFIDGNTMLMIPNWDESCKTELRITNSKGVLVLVLVDGELNC
tara:strand:+ start:272 stop:682 length:411 start_codon:yes stop_codon:yes gene_type:complete